MCKEWCQGAIDVGIFRLRRAGSGIAELPGQLQGFRGEGGFGAGDMAMTLRERDHEGCPVVGCALEAARRRLRAGSAEGAGRRSQHVGDGGGVA